MICFYTDFVSSATIDNVPNRIVGVFFLDSFDVLFSEM